MSRSARDYVDALRNNTNTDSDTRPDATYIVENEPRVGLFDLPPEDPRSREHVSGRRSSRSTERNVQYRATRDREEGQRRRSNDTRARNASLRRTRIQDPPSQTNYCSHEPRKSNRVDTEEVCGVAQRGRSHTICDLSGSPSPRSTNYEIDRSAQATEQSQYTYKYETLDHEGLIKCAQEEFGLDVRGCDTQTIINKVRLAATEQAPEVGSARRSASIVLLPSTPFKVGGGWSQQVLGSSHSTGPPGKRSSGIAELSDGSSKRQRKQILVDEDTATEPETEDDLVNNVSARMVATQILAMRPALSSDGSPRPPNRGTHPPPPSLGSTPSTDLDSQLSNTSSHSPGDSLAQYGVSLLPSEDHATEAQPPSEGQATSGMIGRLPRLLAPVTGPVHIRLRKRLIDRALHGTSCEGSQARSVGNANKANDRRLTDEVSETNTRSITHTSHPAPQQLPNNLRTYCGHRSYVLSEPEGSIVESTNLNSAGEEPAPPGSPKLTASQVIRRERARAFAAKAREEMAEMAPRHRPLFVAPSKPPTSCTQSRPPLRGNSAYIQSTGGNSRRLDPVSAAREDMLAFNRAVANGQATSFVASVIQQSERNSRCAPPQSRRTDELLDDNEEVLLQAEAYAKQRWPLHPARVQKPKPLARDVSGLEQQVLIMAKLHLFAYALVEGVYQTRATYLRWAVLVHQATWEMDLPDHPYGKPADDIYEIMVNGIATLRGKVKERLREFVARVAGFQHTTKNQSLIENNLIRFNRLYPNSFHCKTVQPRSGDYESPEIGRCIALALFHGPNSVGVLYPDYFRDIPLTVVAFALAMWQFCIEEWANGWWQNGDLGTAAMRDKYEAQLAGLKELRKVAPRRMDRLQNRWKDYIAEYSGAAFVPESDTLSAKTGQMRPDTPECEAISVEEMEACLFETARQNSLSSRMRELAADELAQAMDASEDDKNEPQPASSCSPSLSSIEYNEYGVLTAHSKGKGRDT